MARHYCGCIHTLEHTHDRPPHTPTPCQPVIAFVDKLGAAFTDFMLHRQIPKFWCSEDCLPAYSHAAQVTQHLLSILPKYAFQSQRLGTIKQVKMILEASITMFLQRISQISSAQRHATSVKDKRIVQPSHNIRVRRLSGQECTNGY
jgi:hypothetical protein